MTATERLRELLDERGVEWSEEEGHTLWWGESAYHRASAYSSFTFGENDRVHLSAMVTPEQAIAATLGTLRPSLPHWWTADGTLHVDAVRQPVRVHVHTDVEDRTFELRGECREVYLLKATDIGDGREYALGIYATESAATAAIEQNRFGYAFHHVQKWAVE